MTIGARQGWSEAPCFCAVQHDLPGLLRLKGKTRLRSHDEYYVNCTLYRLPGTLIWSIEVRDTDSRIRFSELKS